MSTANPFRYFLPAYLVACIEGEAELDTAPLNVTSSLTPPAQADTAAGEAFSARVAAFTSEQARAVADYLELAQDRERTAGVSGRSPENAARRALGYWRLREREP